MIETIVVLLIVVVLVSGVYAVSTAAADQQTANAAVRNGGRVAADLGDNGWAYWESGSPAEVDSQVVSAVCDVAVSMPGLAGIVAITVYQPPSSGNGAPTAASASDVYDFPVGPPNCTTLPTPTYVNTPTGCINSGDVGYTLDCRDPEHPGEAPVGVFLEYRYKSGTPVFSINQTFEAWTVVTITPDLDCGSGCWPFH
jgi:hypothetical protein